MSETLRLDWVYRNGLLVGTGYPAHHAPLLAAGTHNCDAMGCPSAGPHNMVSIRVPDDAVAVLRSFTEKPSLDELRALHERMQDAPLTGDDGEVPHDGHSVCGCSVAREIQRLIRGG